ncbi:MAG: DNA cytosine methyltransferase [Acutalibacteraceae bacterium]|nr:DNA cytosine methyltransferase [Acutalibacteraceae bacterium]
MELTCASFFAGVGGIDKGFEMAGFKTIFANEFDKNAATTYTANFPDVDLKVCDIKELDENKDIPNFDVLLAGFPCQAFSIAGYRQGFDDEKGRGNLFFELIRIIKKKKPKVIFLENVKNLLTHDNGNTFSVIYNALNELGYHVKKTVLNSCDYGNIPQTRERIYIVCFKDERQLQKFDFPKKINLEKKLSDVIDFKGKKDKNYYYTERCNFYNELSKCVTSSETCYQWRRVYVRENKSNLCPTLTANMGTGGHNVPIIKTYDNRIRKLTPRECFNLQGFPEDFILPDSLCNGALYKQAGNSVVVTVIYRIAEEIKKALK